MRYTLKHFASQHGAVVWNVLTRAETPEACTMKAVSLLQGERNLAYHAAAAIVTAAIARGAASVDVENNALPHRPAGLQDL